MSGLKTYAMALLAVLVGILCLIGVDTSAFGITPDNAFATIWAGLTAAFMRRGVAKSAQG